MENPRLDRLPPRVLPLLYFGCAHVALALALLTVATDPRAVAGFFYHSRMVAVVHLVTLGWITLSILGALYVVLPTAFRASMPARRVDYVAFATILIGVIGMVAHFLIAEFGGMAWSALMVGGGIVPVAIRTLRALRRAHVPAGPRLHVGLAFANLGLAATAGVLLGFDKVYRFLPGYVLTNVYAHAHLAAIGWVLMMAVGMAYRLFPMLLPSAMPSGSRVMATAVLLEIGAIGLFGSLIAQSAMTAIFAATTAAGVAVFVANVRWMRRHRKAPPPTLPRPDYGVRHAMAATAWLVVACAAGVTLALAPAGDLTLRLALGYGAAGLVGGFAQLVVGVESRLLPLFAWYWAFANTGFAGPVPSPHTFPSVMLLRTAFLLWSIGVPALAVGLVLNAPTFVAAGGWSLLAAVLLSSVNGVRVARHAFMPGGGAGVPEAGSRHRRAT
jgi:hypothetical protein